MTGRVLFVGCGPGAPDLLTLRAQRAIAAADIVIWGSGLLAREAVEAHVRPEADILEWPPATRRDVLAAYDRARDEGLCVARLKAGDPALFGEMREELAAVRERGLSLEVVPGVSALSAGAARLACELPADAELLLTTEATAQRARSISVFMAGRDPAATQEMLLAGGLEADDPCVIIHRVSWPGELIVPCRVGEVAERLEDLGLRGLTLVLAGGNLDEPPSPRS